MAIILGIDPGSQITGYGLIEYTGSHIKYIASGCINAKKGDMPERLAKIFIALQQIIKTYHPQILAIEKAFMAKNPNVAIVLGQARGVAIVAASSQDIPVFEYAPRYIKKAVVGTGAAAKHQVQHMVRILLNLTKEPQEDAADALATAICHIYNSNNLITSIDC